MIEIKGMILSTHKKTWSADSVLNFSLSLSNQSVLFWFPLSAQIKCDIVTNLSEIACSLTQRRIYRA